MGFSDSQISEGRHDKCEMKKRTSAGEVTCAQPAVATVHQLGSGDVFSWRVCAEHARSMQTFEGPTGGPSIIWDSQ